MANTYILISSTTLGSDTASVTFSSIPNTYTDLLLRVCARTTHNNWIDELQIRFNSDSGSNYSATHMDGVGSTASSQSVVNNTSVRFVSIVGSAATSSTFSNTEILIPNYLSTSSRPSESFSVVENISNSQNRVIKIAGLYRGSSAISSMVLSSYDSANFVTNSSFYLYGIKNS